MVNLALIGVGNWGKNYISTAKLIPGCKIKYLCAQSNKHLDNFDDGFIKITNYKKLFALSDIDGIILATPNLTHYNIAKDFIKKGCNLLIEKPLTQNYKQAQDLLKLQRKSKSKVLVGHTYLFDPAYKKAKTLTKDLSKIRYISYEGSNDGPYRKDASTFWDVGPHAVSLCIDINQAKIKSVNGWGIDTLKPNSGFYDFANIKLNFSDNSKAFIKITWLFPVKRRELAIIGKRDTLIYDACSEKKLVLYKNMINPKKTNMLKTNTTKLEFPKYDKKTPLEEELTEFIDAIENNRSIKISTLKEAVEITRIIEIIERSILQNGKLQKV